jgi:hypothetical protein
MAKPKKNVEIAEVDETSVAAEQPTAIECKEVELGYTKADYEAIKMSAENFGTYVAKFVTPKYPNKYIAEVHKEDVSKGYLGWEMLKIDTATHTVEVTKSKDEAHRRSNLILCWKDRRRHEIEHAQWKEKQDRFNRFVAQEGSASQSKEFNRSIEQMTNGQITAKPLAANEADE